MSKSAATPKGTEQKIWNVFDVHDYWFFTQGSRFTLPSKCRLQVLYIECIENQRSRVMCCVVRSGSVSLRDWTSPDYYTYRMSRRKKNSDSAAEKLKTSLCFYYIHHPDGCPLSTSECRFAHGVEDLRSSQPKESNCCLMCLPAVDRA